MSADLLEEAAAVGVETELMTGNAKEDDEGGGGCKRRLRSKPLLIMGRCCLALV